MGFFLDLAEIAVEVVNCFFERVDAFCDISLGVSLRSACLDA
jgi:hypothetical protein